MTMVEMINSIIEKNPQYKVYLSQLWSAKKSTIEKIYNNPNIKVKFKNTKGVVGRRAKYELEERGNKIWKKFTVSSSEQEKKKIY